MKKYVSAFEAAFVGISVATLRRWDKQGKLDSITTEGN